MVFNILSKTTYDKNIEIKNYQDHKTKMKVVFVKTPSIETSIYIVVPTLDCADDGKPHSLEHLIFCGSMLHNCKGKLNKIAGENYVDGINAWTARDHTCYQCHTISQNAISHILKIYLEQIYYPNITKDNFITEIYHMDGKGENGGVVFNEMKSKEFQPETIGFNEMASILFQGTPYASTTGGKIQDIPTLTLERLYEYHAKYYQPSSSTIVIIGNIDDSEIIDILENITYDVGKVICEKNRTEQNLIEKNQHKIPMALQYFQKIYKYFRPNNAPMENNKTTLLRYRSITYPSATKTQNYIIGWLGRPHNEYSKHMIYSFILNFVVETVLTEKVKSQALASDIYWYSYNYQTIGYVIYLENVNKKLPSIVVNSIIQIFENFDIKSYFQQIQVAIRNKINQIKYMNETNPSELIIDLLIEQHLYNVDTLQNLEFYRILLQKDMKFWVEQYNDFLLQFKKHTIVETKSSRTLAKNMMNEEKRINSLQKKELEQNKKFIDTAVSNNNKLNRISCEIVPINHNFDSIFKSIENVELKKNKALDTEFYKVFYSIDFYDWTFEEKQLLGFYLNCIFSSDVTMGSEIIGYTKVKEILNSYFFNFYFKTHFLYDRVDIVFIFNADVYPISSYFNIMETIVMNTCFNQRTITLQKHKLMEYEDIVNSKNHLLVNVMAVIHNKKDMKHSFSPLLQNELLKNNQTLIQNLKRLQQKFIKKIRLSRFIQPEKYHNHQADFPKISKINIPKIKISNFRQSKIVLFNDTYTSSYLLHTTNFQSLTNGLYSLQTLLQKEVVATIIIQNYFNQHNTELWDGIRGKGLAYTVRMTVDVSKFLFNLHISRSSNISKAYKEFIKIVQNFNFQEKYVGIAKKKTIQNLLSQNEDKHMILHNITSFNEIHSNDAMTYSQYLRKKIDIVENLDIQTIETVFQTIVKNFMDKKESSVVMITNRETEEIKKMFNDEAIFRKI